MRKILASSIGPLPTARPSPWSPPAYTPVALTIPQPEAETCTSASSRDIPSPSPWPGPTNGMPRRSIPTPLASANFSFLCVKEHVTNTIYECHLPSERPMILTFRDERRPEKPVVSTIRAILGPGTQQFISPNDLHIQYYSWSCVDNCILPEFHWRRILNEKYDVTPAPKVYSLMTPDHDGQELSVKIKSPIPLTVALLPSHLADQVYDKTVSLTDALDQTGCKERGVQSMSFNCSFNVANGPQTLFILPDISFSGHKKADVEVNTVKCVEHCDLLNPPVNP